MFKINTCFECGDDFEYNICDISFARTEFCSNACYEAYNRLKLSLDEPKEDISTEYSVCECEDKPCCGH